MALPPFDPDETKPAASDLISQYPSVEQTFRDIVEDWILIDHNRDGEHAQVTLEDQDTTEPAGLAGHITLFNDAGVLAYRVGTGAIQNIQSSADADAKYVELVGDTMTGDLILDKTTALLGLGRSGDTGPHGITFAGDNLPADKEMAIFYRTSAGGTMAIEDSAANILLAVARSGTISLNNAVTGTALATQAEAETGTNNDQLMTPLRSHQAAVAANPVKIVVKLTTLTGTPTITTTYNQQGTLSAVRNSLGNYTLSWTTALSNPVAQAIPQRASPAYSHLTGISTTSVTVQVRDGGSGAVDPDALFVTVMGT